MVYVVFTELGARVIKNPTNEADFVNNPNVVKDPNLTHMSGIPPHFWKLENGTIVAMDENERHMREHKISSGSFVEDYQKLNDSGKADLAKNILRKEFSSLLVERGLTPAQIEENISRCAGDLVHSAMLKFKSEATIAVQESVTSIEVDLFTLEKKMGQYVQMALVAHAVVLIILGFVLSR